MSQRLLSVDVGNTQTTIGLFDGTVLTERWHMATRVARTSDELWVFLRQFCSASAIEIGSHRSFPNSRSHTCRCPAPDFTSSRW